MKYLDNLKKIIVHVVLVSLPNEPLKTTFITHYTYTYIIMRLSFFRYKEI